MFAAIDAHVPPLDTSQSLVTQIGPTSHLPMWGWLQSPLVHVVAASGLLIGLWWGLDHTLGEAVASLLPVQG